MSMLHTRKDLEAKLNDIVVQTLASITTIPGQPYNKVDYVVNLTNAISRFGEMAAPLSKELERAIEHIVNVNDLTSFDIVTTVKRTHWWAQKVMENRIKNLGKHTSPPGLSNPIAIMGVDNLYTYSNDTAEIYRLHHFIEKQMPRLAAMEARYCKANSRDVEGSYFVYDNTIRIAYDMVVEIKQYFNTVRLQFNHSCHSNRGSMRGTDYRNAGYRVHEYQNRYYKFLSLSQHLDVKMVNPDLVEITFKPERETIQLESVPGPKDYYIANTDNPFKQLGVVDTLPPTVTAKSPLDFMKSMSEQLETHIKELKSEHATYMRNHKEYVQKAKDAAEAGRILLGDIQSLETALAVLERTKK